MNRKEHLAWCKERALAYVETGDLDNAWASMSSDMMKHKETENHIALGLDMAMLMGGHLSTAQKMRGFIRGFN